MRRFKKIVTFALVYWTDETGSSYWDPATVWHFWADICNHPPTATGHHKHSSASYKATTPCPRLYWRKFCSLVSVLLSQPITAEICVSSNHSRGWSGGPITVQHLRSLEVGHLWTVRGRRSQMHKRGGRNFFAFLGETDLDWTWQGGWWV